DDTSGALVTKFYQGSPAEASGLRLNDVIVAIDNTRIATGSDVPSNIGPIAPGTEVVLTIYRSGQRIRVPVALALRPRVL
ncbi:PDZ domain-containing protein, partial [Serratia liquefaciens]|uniref:PDZ domain-containing protein n=1 Tax=Serratia liquefaciens TaxID=614 RepID=UPI0023625546